MEATRDVINRLILDPAYADILAVVKAARNGAVYGAKVRFPHALVMVFLFRSGTIREKFKLIFRATRTHARNLAKFATIYKLTCLVLRRLNHGKERKYDTFFAGLIGGYGVFGRGIQSSVNQQISIYVFARVVLALAKMSTQKHVVPDPNGSTTRNAWPVFASLSWAFVMYIFRWYPDMLQPSLRNSMKYIYVNADHWDSLRNFLLHNT